MIVYRESKKQFLKDAYNDQIEKKIEEKVLEKLHKKTSTSEFNAWRNSMQYMYKVMEDKRIPNDCDIAIEYRIPNSNKRVDFIICGENDNNIESAVIIELKQWDMIEKIDSKDGIVKTVLQGRMTSTSHPSYQAWSYACLINDYNESVRKHHIELKPCAYLHNYDLSASKDIIDDTYKYYLDRSPVFTRGDTYKLASFISKYIKKGNPDVMYHIECGKIKPSKTLQDNVAGLLNGNNEFILLDEQKVVYENILELARNDDHKQVVIIHGGPGTGKSVLAINLLSAILNMDKNVLYVSKNAAPRNVYRKMLTNNNYKVAYIDNLFKGSGCFVDTKQDLFDCLIVDEAHRLNEKSGLFRNMGENQIKEIINAAKLSIFFVDDNQMVTLQDIGSSDEIKKWSNYYHAEIYEDELVSQFRCNGSDSYISWLDNVLEINTELDDEFEFDYDIRIFDDPVSLRQNIYAKNHLNNKSRIVAGYCWDWISGQKNNSNYHDIKINDFEMSWNLDSSDTWAIDEDSVNEAGCIHTCQGLEFDYVGVIIGEDLRYEDGHLVTDFTKRAKTDQSLKGIKKLYKEDKKKAELLADKIIKNTYRTLLSRGQKGCYIYCVDHNLSEYLKKRLIKGK